MNRILYNSPELTGRQKVVGPHLNVADSDIEAGRNDSDLVKSTGQVNNDLATAVIVNDFELADVTVLHHDLKESDDDLRRRSQKNLSLASLFSIVNAFEGRSQ